MLEKIEVFQIEYQRTTETLENIFQALHSKKSLSEKLKTIAILHNSYTYEIGKIEGMTDPKRSFEGLSMGYYPTIEDEIKVINFHKL